MGGGHKGEATFTETVRAWPPKRSIRARIDGEHLRHALMSPPGHMDSQKIHDTIGTIAEAVERLEERNAAHEILFDRECADF
jgi:hypothetical protein